MSQISRRKFLAAAGASLPAAGLLPASAESLPDAFSAVPAAELSRAERAARIRTDAANLQKARAVPVITTNGDEERFANRIGSFSKGLPQDRFGDVQPAAYDALLKALKSGRHAEFEHLPRAGGRTLSNPQSAFAFQLEGADSHAHELAPPPSITTQACADDINEMYWQALCRDVPFAEYGTSPLIAKAARSMGRTPATVFRGPSPGEMQGPYLSQFLLKPIPFGCTRIQQQYTVPKAGSDFMTTFSDWVQIQNGFTPILEAQYETQPRYLRNGRDLAEFVHYDFAYQAGLDAALILINSAATSIHNCNQFRSGNNPYRYSTVEDGFVTFGPAEACDWLGRVTTAALKAAYYQKWAIHRRVRPETLGALIHKTRAGIKPYPLHKAMLDSEAVNAVYARTGSYLLSQAYPEGAPLHPSYPSGHAAIIGACAVVLKACFDGSMLVPACVEPTADGLHLQPCKGYSPTVNAEINKLAFNVSMGRGWGGIHYRTDHLGGLELGEKVGISMLQDLVRTYTEDFGGFSLERFDGTRIHIRPDGTVSGADA